MKCQKCGNEFPEKEIHDSHDIPKYLGGTDSDGKHWLCYKCHNKYETEIIHQAVMEMMKRDYNLRRKGRRAAYKVKKRFFKKKDNE